MLETYMLYYLFGIFIIRAPPEDQLVRSYYSNRHLTHSLINDTFSINESQYACHTSLILYKSQNIRKDKYFEVIIH